MFSAPIARSYPAKTGKLANGTCSTGSSSGVQRGVKGPSGDDAARATQGLDPRVYLTEAST